MSEQTRPFFLIISIVCTIGNLLVLVLFLKKKAWLKKTHNCLIFALALQDVLTGFCLIVIPSFNLPEDYYKVPENTIARELFCRLVWSQYLIFSLGITSIYTCVALTVERWLAVFKPILYRNISQSRLCVSLLVLLPWIAAFAVEFGTVITVHNKKMQNGSSFVCFWEDFNTVGHAQKIFQPIVMFLGIIGIPGIFVVVSYVQIVNRVRKSRNAVTGISEIETTENANIALLRKMTVVAFVTSASVILCWLPSQFHFMLVQLGTAKNNSPMHKIFKVLAFSNACLNPFIYCFSKSSYRKGFEEMLIHSVRAFCCKK